ncbi:MAG TPA: GrpB family protein [Nocardioides sp.]|nr:GrpB family protein [Nocardioides sp.]
MSIEVVDWSPRWAEQFEEEAVRDVLRSRDDLREAYAAVKRALASDPGMDIDTYLAGKSAVLQEVLQEVLEASGELTRSEMEEIRRLDGG